MAGTKQNRLGSPGPAREETTPANGSRQVDAYEEDWYRSLRALAESRSLLGEDEPAEDQSTTEETADAGDLEGTPEAAEVEPTTSAVTASPAEEPETTPISDEATEVRTALLQDPPVEAAPDPPEATAPLAPLAPPVDRARERRDEITELASRAIGEPEGVRLAALALDPDPDVRQQALATLSGNIEHVEETTITRALDDPVDEVRAAAVRLASELGQSCLPHLARLVGARRWPLTQRTTLEVLPGVFASQAVDTAHLDQILEAVGQLDPGPDNEEQTLLDVLGRAIGTEELVASLEGPDPARLGAVRLLAADRSNAVLRTLAAMASDPVEEIRNRATRAADEIRTDPAPSGTETSPPVRPVAAQTEQLDRVASLALSLSDPDGSVRHLALSGLGGVDRATVLAWVRQAVGSQDQTIAMAAIVTTAVLGLSEAAADALSRAADLARRDRQHFLEQLASCGVETERLAGLLPSVEEPRRPEAIGKMWDLLGPESLPAIRGFLDDPSVASRLAAVEALGRSEDAGSTPLVTTVFRRDVSPIVRAAAIRAAARLGGSDAVSPIRDALTDPDPDVRVAAVDALSQHGEEEASGPLMEALSDTDERVRRTAAHHLALTRSGDHEVVWQALLRLPPESRVQLIETFERANPGALSGHALEALRSLDHDERLLAAEVVGWGFGQACVEAAIHALLDPSAAVRRAATDALARLRDPSAAGALGKALGDPDPDVRLGVVRALGVIDDESVLGFLVSALSDPDTRVRQAASEVLTEWSSPAVAKRLAGVLAVPALRGPASDLLTRMGPTCVELLIDVLLQQHAGVAPTVGELLGRIVGLDELISRLDSVDPERRLRAVEAVGAIGGEDVIGALIRTLSDPDERIRLRSAQLLGALGGAGTIEALRGALGDPVPSVQAAVEESLSRMPGQAFASGM